MKEEQLDFDVKKFLENKKKVMETINIPESADLVVYLESEFDSKYKLANKKQQFLVWKSKYNICFFPFSVDYVTMDSKELKTIPIKEIVSVSQTGEVYRETKISGGGGGGSSLQGAILGGLVAGGSGAIIGSRKGIEPIKSQLITHDTRETNIGCYDEDNGIADLLSFRYFDYETFAELLPEKILGDEKKPRKKKLENQSTKKETITDQIRELSKLKDEGIITEQEFNEKKKQLLDKIG